MSESFKGCMRRFELNEEAIDLSGARSIMGVNRCYENVERGAFFNGYAYAQYGMAIRTLR